MDAWEKRGRKIIFDFGTSLPHQRDLKIDPQIWLQASLFTMWHQFCETEYTQLMLEMVIKQHLNMQ